MNITKCSIMVLTVVLISCNDKTKLPCENIDNVIKSAVSDVNYTDCGQGEITLLFVHGWNLNKSYWSNQIEVFSKNFRVISIDLPGFGKSNFINQEYSIQAYTDEIKSLIEQLELKNTVLIGHSMGGRVILETAQNNNRVIAMVGVDNFKEAGQKMTEELQAEVDGWIAWLEADFKANSPIYADQYLLHDETDSTVRNRILNDYMMANPQKSISALQAYLSYEYQEVDRLTNLSIPLYLISSDSSPVDTVSLEKTGLGYKVYEISQTGHFPMVEQPEVFNSHLKEALSDILQRLK